ncbi:hypothetical protein FOVSG1_000642 [Fusarium oxysporum f. sp. vasinfectum]
MASSTPWLCLCLFLFLYSGVIVFADILVFSTLPSLRHDSFSPSTQDFPFQFPNPGQRTSFFAVAADQPLSIT